MMDHIRQRDWNSTKNLYNHFVDERDIDNCVVERIIRNKFWDPMISSDEEDPPGPIDWGSVFTKKSSRDSQFRCFVPGYRKAPLHPKLSALTLEEHRKCIKVLSAQNEHILLHEFVGKPSKADLRTFEEKKDLYATEQKEYIEWARHLWTTTNCIRTLRPKPLVEVVYETEYKMKSLMIKDFPKSYILAAQIPLRADNHTCEMILPKTDLIKVDISKLPIVYFPNIYKNKESIIRKCSLPEACPQHPCKFKLPREAEQSLLPLSDIHSELAQFALEVGAEFVASESGARCLLETDRTWSLPLSVCEVIGPDGDKSNVVVLGSEFPEKKEPGPMRSYRAFRHLLLHAFTMESSRTRTFSDISDCSTQMNFHSQQTTTIKTRSNVERRGLRSKGNRKVSSDCHRTALAYNSALKKVAHHLEASDSEDEVRLEIVMDDDDGGQNTSVINDENDKSMTNGINNSNGHDPGSPPRKILKACPRLSTEKKSQTENLEDTDCEDHMTLSNIQKSIKQLDDAKSQAMDKSDSVESKHNDSQESSQTNAAESSETDSQLLNQTDIDEPLHQSGIQEEQFDIELHSCVCKDFEMPSPRSYKNLKIKNHTTKDQINIIVHTSHKLKVQNGVSPGEVVLEPILEYQLDIGGTMQSPQKIQSLAFALMLRKHALLANVRVDGTCGEIVAIEKTDLRELTARHGDFKPHIANTLYTVLNQLAGLLPGQYILKHEPGHGANAILYTRARGSEAEAARVPLQAPDGALTPAEEARFVQAAPALGPVLLPVHKYRRQLPLTFTCHSNAVAKETSKPTFKKKAPPTAMLGDDNQGGGKKKWPKKTRRKKGKEKYSN